MTPSTCTGPLGCCGAGFRGLAPQLVAQRGCRHPRERLIWIPNTSLPDDPRESADG